MAFGARSTILFAVLAAAVGCAVNQGTEPGGEEAEIRELERRAVGPAKEYPADRYSDADAETFATSKKARRQLGWHVLAKALAPVRVAADLGSGEASTPTPVVAPTVPLFRTWVGGDEFDRMFAKMYGDLGKERRLRADAPTKREVQGLFDWNASSLGPFSEADYFARLAQITNRQGVDGLGGNARVAYSPAYVRQYFSDYPTMATCADKLDTLDVDTPPISEKTNFTNCMSQEFAPEAAVIKASWRRNDAVVSGLPVVDTSAGTLKRRLAGDLDNGGWNTKGLPTKAAGPDEAYSVKLTDDSEYSLVGLHVMTKELRHWVWVTVWWSPDGDADFGQDRPEEIKKLGAPWDHYKMCVVTDFDEKDPDPRGGFEGSLGDALAAVHGRSTWCSNAFIEKGDHNAQTNCIGCHQHAGDTRALDSILVDESKFPAAGRTQVRKGFPADYSWAFATPASPDQKDRLMDVVVNRMKVFTRDDEGRSGGR